MRTPPRHIKHPPEIGLRWRSAIVRERVERRDKVVAITYRARLGDEIVHVTAQRLRGHDVALTVTRGCEGTEAVPHPAGTPLVMIA